MFPLESKTKNAYFCKETNSKNAASGILFNKYRTIARKYRGFINNSEGEVVYNSELQVSQENCNQAEVIEALNWLENNRCPTYTLHEKLIQCWSVTSVKRKPSKDLLKNWSHYKLGIGFYLANEDFRYHFNAKPLTKERFLKFAETEWNSIKNEIKSTSYKKEIDSHILMEDEGNL